MVNRETNTDKPKLLEAALAAISEKEIRRIEKENEDISKFKPLIKLFDRADIINDIA